MSSFVQSLSCIWLWPHGLQHARFPYPSPSPEACSNSCPLSQWCHSTISSSVIRFSSCLQSFLSSGSFPMSRRFASGGQSIGASVSASVLPMNIQDWFPLGLPGWISNTASLQFWSKGRGGGSISCFYEYLLTAITSSIKCIIHVWLSWPGRTMGSQARIYFRSRLSIKGMWPKPFMWIQSHTWLCVFLVLQISCIFLLFSFKGATPLCPSLDLPIIFKLLYLFIKTSSPQ